MRVTEKINNNIFDGNCNISITKESNNVVKFSTIDFIVSKENYIELLDKLKESFEKLLEVEKTSQFRLNKITKNNISKPGCYDFEIDDCYKFEIYNNKKWDGQYYIDNWCVSKLNVENTNELIKIIEKIK